MGVIEIWVSVSFENSYSSCHPFEWGFRVYAESANIGYNWPGLVVICYGNFLLSLLMCGLFDWTKLTPNLPDVLLAPVNNKTMPGSSGVHPWSWAHTLWSQAREHSGEELQSMWNQSDWSGQQLFPDRPSLLLCAVTLLPCTWSHSWSSIQPEDWYVVSWLHPRRALLRKCEFIASLISCTVLCLLVSNYLLVLSMYWRYLCRRYIILSWLFCLFVWYPSGPVPKWFSRNTAGTSCGDSGAYWPSTFSKGKGYPQILHQESHALWAKSGT